MRTRTTRGVGAGEALTLLSVVAYTVVNALTRLVAADIDPFVASLVRMLPLATAAAIAAVMLRPAPLRPSSPTFLGVRSLVGLAAAGVVAYVVGNTAIVLGFAWAGLAASIVAVQGAGVISAAIASALVLREAPTRTEVVGAVVVLAGLGVSLLATIGGGLDARWGWGILAAVVAGTCYTAGNLAGRAAQRGRTDTFVPVLAVTQVAGTIGLLIISVVRAPSVGGLLGGAQPTELWALVGVGLANLVATGALTLAARYTTVTSIATVSVLIIVTSVVVAAVTFGETVPWPTIAGAVLIVLGVVFAARPARAPA